MATVAAVTAAELPLNAAEDSNNILPLMLGKPRVSAPSQVVNHDYRGNFAIRKGKWKLVSGKPDRLFDLDEDPKEANNVAAAHPEIVAQMSKTLVDYKTTGRSVLRADEKDAGEGQQ